METNEMLQRLLDGQQDLKNVVTRMSGKLELVDLKIDSNEEKETIRRENHKEQFIDLKGTVISLEKDVEVLQKNNFKLEGAWLVLSLIGAFLLPYILKFLRNMKKSDK